MSSQWTIFLVSFATKYETEHASDNRRNVTNDRSTFPSHADLDFIGAQLSVHRLHEPSHNNSDTKRRQVNTTHKNRKLIAQAYIYTCGCHTILSCFPRSNFHIITESCGQMRVAPEQWTNWTIELHNTFCDMHLRCFDGSDGRLGGRFRSWAWAR